MVWNGGLRETIKMVPGFEATLNPNLKVGENESWTAPVLRMAVGKGGLEWSALLFHS
jgi:hypothetical protein